MFKLLCVISLYCTVSFLRNIFLFTVNIILYFYQYLMEVLYLFVYFFSQEMKMLYVVSKSK